MGGAKAVGENAGMCIGSSMKIQWPPPAL